MTTCGLLFSSIGLRIVISARCNQAQSVEQIVQNVLGLTKANA